MHRSMSIPYFLYEKVIVALISSDKFAAAFKKKFNAKYKRFAL